MQRFFNTAGPCEPEWHFMVPPLQRLPEAQQLVERGQYFVLHAPRQTGKTTFLRAFAKSLTASGRFVALHFSCEVGEVAREDSAQAQASVLMAMRMSAQNHLDEPLRPPRLQLTGRDELDALSLTLSAWARQVSLPLVLLFDEIDALQGDSLVSVLRQLRAGYNDRGPGRFPWSVALCGLRDVRDYKAASGGDPSRLGTSSPFNIKVESLRLGDFDGKDIASLYAQHTAQSGQPFTAAAVDAALELSGGQPWLVNALGREVVDKIKVPLDQPITAEHLEVAKERLILARQTHLDSLVAKLHEPRVRRVMVPLLAGSEPSEDISYDDDVAYVRDLGLIKAQPPIRPANAIYREIVVRVLSSRVTDTIVLPPRTFTRPDGSLDLRVVFDEFAAFWTQHGEALQSSMPYHEVACELILSAWLQRVVNGGGHIERQYALGNRRMDVLVRWPPSGDLLAPLSRWQREALELKVWRSGEPDPLPRGLAQLEGYLHSLGLSHGWLILFDRRAERPPIEERTQFHTANTPTHGYAVDVLRA
jgi:hypothetical protein